jgi:hypothetical protein
MRGASQLIFSDRKGAVFIGPTVRLWPRVCKNTFLIVRASAHCSWAWQFPDYLPRSAPVTLQSAYEALWHLFGAVKAGLLRRHRLQQADSEQKAKQKI